MSNSIWKTPDKKPERFRTVIFQSIELEEPELGHWDGQTICPHNEFESLDMSQITRWCYLDCLIAQADKAERLQKAVDLLSGHLRDVLQLDERGHIKLDEITKQQIKTAISDPVGIITQLEQESNN